MPSLMNQAGLSIAGIGCNSRSFIFWWTTVRVYLLLQEISTVVGLVIVLVAYRRWLGRRPASFLTFHR